MKFKIMYAATILNDNGRLLFWGLTTRQPLWVILCRLPEKRREKR